MSTGEIIDVVPVEHSSSRGGSGTPRYRGDSASGARAHTGGAGAQHAGRPPQAARAGGLLSALALIAFGVLLAMVGVPMLVLPGPGLLTIGAGVALAASGMRRLARWRLSIWA